MEIVVIDVFIGFFKVFLFLRLNHMNQHIRRVASKSTRAMHKAFMSCARV